MKHKLLLLLLVFAKGFSQNAVLDTTFGVNGKVTTSFGLTIPEIRKLDIQLDGKIIACGLFKAINEDKIVLTRYNIDGSLDLTFGINGKVVNTEFYSSHSKGLKIQSDGKIIVFGQAQLTNATADKALMLRYNTDGTLDTTFGINGVVNVSSSGSSSSIVADLLILSNDKILIPVNTNQDNVQVMRYNSDGTIDASFGFNGTFNFNLGNNSFTQSNESVSSLSLQLDGKIILAGGTDLNNIPEQWDAFLMRLNIDGNIDTSFGNNGLVITNFDGREGFSNVNIKNDGIIASGFSFGSNNTAKIILAKYDYYGTLDSNFGMNGKVITQTSSSNMFDISLDMKIQSDGKILCFGQNGRGFNIFSSASQPSDMLILRYNTNGSLDTTFSSTGYITTNFDDNLYNTGWAVVLQNDGKIVAGGSTLNLTTGGSFALARYTFDNLATNSFSSNENFKISPNPAHDFLTILGNQKIEQVSIFDVTGKVVFDIKTNENKLDVSELQNGIYFVKIVANDKVFQQKFVKEY